MQHNNQGQPGDVKDLLDKLLREAERLDLHALERDYPQPLHSSEPFDDQPNLPMRDNYYLGELLKFDGRDFIRNMYRALIHRNPEEEGLAHWLSLLQQGQPKVLLLLAFKQTEEARQRAVTLLGLPPLLEKWYQHRLASRLGPLYRRVLQWLVATAERQLPVTRPDETQLILEQANRLQQVSATTLDMVSHFNWAPLSTLRQLEHRMALLEQQAARAQPSHGDGGSTTDTSVPAADLDAFYLAFENHCRTDPEALRTHLQQYLPYLPEAVNGGPLRAVDLGCGRGEWLDILRRQGVEVEGVDSSPLMRRHCESLGLVVHGDALLPWLQQQPDARFDIVSAFHLAEHLPFELLLRLVVQAKRLLKPGGCLIIETPNPENIMVATHTFYHDPTHRNPLTPTLLSFLADYVGLADSQVLRLNPYPPEHHVPGDDPLTQRINGHFCGPQDMALLAYQPHEGETTTP